MYIDKNLEIDDGDAITTTRVSSDVINLVGSGEDIGQGKQLYAVFQVDTTFTAGGSATLTISVDSSAATALTTPTTHAATEAIPVASLVAGYQRVLALPPGTYLQYLGINYTVATGPMTAGSCSAWITSEPPQGWKAYPDAL